MSGVDGIDGGTHAPTPRAMTDEEARAVACFLADQPDFTVAWKGNATNVAAHVSCAKGATLTVSCHRWASAGELAWALSEAVKVLEATDGGPAHDIGVKFTQHTVEE